MLHREKQPNFPSPQPAEHFVIILFPFPFIYTAGAWHQTKPRHGLQSYDRQRARVPNEVQFFAPGPNYDFSDTLLHLFTPPNKRLYERCKPESENQFLVGN